MIESIQEKENRHFFHAFCSLLCILHGKKLNLPNIVLLLLKNANYRSVFKQMTSAETDYEIYQMFLNYDATLSKSKYLSKYLNRQ